jgi:hypothetical protein
MTLDFVTQTAFCGALLCHPQLTRAPRASPYDIGLANDAGAADERKLKIYARQLCFTKVCLLQSMLFGR